MASGRGTALWDREGVRRGEEKNDQKIIIYILGTF